jgi:hypothetical protein
MKKLLANIILIVALLLLGFAFIMTGLGLVMLTGPSVQHKPISSLNDVLAFNRWWINLPTAALLVVIYFLLVRVLKRLKGGRK